jgi:ABC-type multidrug transport system fused ATPase/permease subunit
MSSKYLELVKYYSDLKGKEAAKSNIISLLRLFLALMVLISVYRFFQDFQTIWTIISLVLIIIFLILVKIHKRVIDSEHIYFYLTQINEDENEYIQHDYLPFDNGEEYLSPFNPFTIDLDIFGIQSLFQHINRTETFMGKERLSQILIIGLEPNNIVFYNEAIQELVAKLTWRQNFRAVARLYPDNKEAYSSLIKWADMPANTVTVFQRILYYLFPVVLNISAFLFIINRVQFLALICCILFLVNLLILLINYQNVQNSFLLAEKAYKAIEKYSQLIRMIEIEEFSSLTLKELKLTLKSNQIEASKYIKRFAGILEKFETINNPWALILLNGFFLYHLHTLVSLSEWKLQHSFHLKSFLNTVGEFDALGSLANFAFNNPDFIYPKINYEGSLCFKGLSHPLIKKHLRVLSDISFNEQRFILLTGSNMSGKSTFLRTLGINIVLAKAGLPVCASDANIFPFEILSCIRKTDSLQENESYFLAELKSLKLIIDKLKQGDICFLILDEILRGTNSKDKQIGTIALIEKLISLKAIGIIATHDLEVCELSYKYQDYLSNKCFEVEISNNELVFDYKLREGICKNTSASFLLKQMKIID